MYFNTKRCDALPVFGPLREVDRTTYAVHSTVGAHQATVQGIAGRLGTALLVMVGHKVPYECH